jgi:hypothetical protein
MVYQEHCFISTALFEQWCWDMFCMEIRHRREITGYAGNAVLIMDGLSCHESDLFGDICFDSGVRVELLPAHSSDQLQPCDLSALAATKTNVSRVRVPAGLSKQGNQMIKIIGVLQTSCFRQPSFMHLLKLEFILDTVPVIVA